ncbi:MAG: NAD(+)/NADH kinase [Vicinamibacterales bacterium]
MPTDLLPPVRRVGILAKPNLTDAVQHLEDIAAWLATQKVQAVFERATAELMPAAHGRLAADGKTLATDVDMVLVLGGDGTLIGMADRIGAAGSQVPILGVNFGGLGFLTEVTLPELYPSLEAAIGGHARVERRMMLRGYTSRGGQPHSEHVVLNDAVITKAALSRMIDLSVWVDDELMMRVKADGLIVATPTGSTAYNLAAGGPIVLPSVDAIIVTPIAPHTLTNRPVVIPATSVVRVQPFVGHGEDVFVTFDGQQGFQLQPGDEISISRAERPLRLIRPSTRGYFEVLRTKLKWGGR